MPAEGAARSFRRCFAFEHRLAPQASRSIPENSNLIRDASKNDLMPTGGLELGALAGQVDVVIDVLYIIAIVQHRDELLEHGQVFRTNRLAGLREEGNLLNFPLSPRKRLQQRRFGFVELAGGRKYRQVAI